VRQIFVALAVSAPFWESAHDSAGRRLPWNFPALGGAGDDGVPNANGGEKDGTTTMTVLAASKGSAMRCWRAG
jgi:hypothetical protein